MARLRGLQRTTEQEHACVLEVLLPEIPTTIELENKNIIFEIFRERASHWSCAFSSKCLLQAQR